MGRNSLTVGNINPEILVGIGLILAFYMAFNLGGNDAANPTNMVIGSGALSLKKTVVLFTLFAFLGAYFQGYHVIKTLGKGVVKDIDPIMAISASLGAGLWVTIATRKGLPVSTTHSTVGAIVGVGLMHGYLLGIAPKIEWNVVGEVILSWVTSPLGAMILASILYICFLWSSNLLSRKYNAISIFRVLLIGTMAFSAYAYGANDVGNATGVYVSVVSSTFGVPDQKTMHLLAVLGGFGIMAGALLWGYRVIMTIGFKITRLDYVSGTAAELANASVVYLFTLMGMPVSTTHASVSSVIGVGMAKEKGFSGVDWKMVGLIIAGWVFTLPIAAGLAAGIYSLLYIV
ncbi:MAG: inorganic phosphate transporter [Desulfurococcales archaeon]|nr:inorganic phosphate transporter [Desulfurococcales archaeon]